MPQPVSDTELELDIQAYYDHGGNKSEAARARGLRRSTYLDRLAMAEKRLGVRLGKVVDGRIKASGSLQKKLPKRGQVKRYIMTSIQNNTHLHPGFYSLVALKDYFGNLPNCQSCQLMIGTYSYQKAAYGAKAVKRGKHDRKASREELWYDPVAVPYISDESIELAPGLVWCGEQNILPTNRHPLTGFEDYNGRKSNIIPHAKVAMDSVASMADEGTKFNYTTGTVTQRNYIQKRTGIMAEQKHAYAAILAEVDDQGRWFVRQLHIDEDGRVMDIGPDGSKGIVAMAEGVLEDQDVTAGIWWGDAHAAEMDKWVRDLAWGDGGMLDTLRPKYQFMNDIFSMRSRGHHEIRDFHRSYQKHFEDEETVEDEIQLTTDFANEADRPWCEQVVVPANHDRHLNRWLNEADFRLDPINAKYFCLLQYQVLEAIEQGDKDFNILEWAMKRAGLNPGVRFLSLDESFLLEGIENGLHGDLGPNGSRGSTRGLTKLGRPINKGHDHTAAIRDNVYSAGACSLSFPYMHGPTSHSISHIVTYKNGTRAIVTMYSNKWRA